MQVASRQNQGAAARLDAAVDWLDDRGRRWFERTELSAIVHGFDKR